jgi:urease accessory protein
MIVIEQRAASSDVPGARLVLPFEARCKSRLRTRLESGEEAGLFLERGTVLRNGDRLRANDGRIVEIIAGDEALMEARSEDRMLLARAAYHLGNRHVPVQVGENWLRCAADHVLGDMLAGLGLAVAEIVAPFEPEAGAYAHAHGAGGQTTPGAKLHQYRSGA